jgi:glutamate 5-kinase
MQELALSNQEPRFFQTPMSDIVRQEIAAGAHTIVVKVGTRVLTHADGKLNEDRIASLAEDVNAVRQTGRRVVLVSSGAVGAGMNLLGLDRRPTDLAKLQAVAAIGQTSLIHTYDRTFRKHGRHAAQVLLTAEDFNRRTQYLNVRNTLLSLLDFGAIPIINENDTVAVDELMTTFGDNDRLAALVTNLLRAPLLVILSDVDGLFDGDPAGGQAHVIPLVTHLDDSVRGLIRDKVAGLGRGGMASKLEAARAVVTAGENTIIASGHQPGILVRILAGEAVGTLLVAEGKSVSPRKRWIGFTARPRGKLHLDAGAAAAITRQGRSLLAIGITAADGQFEKGDVVSVCDAQGREIARGLTNYAVGEVQRIQGLQSKRIAQVLGHSPYEEVIHRDNLTLMGGNRE